MSEDVEKANLLGKHYEYISSDKNYSEHFKKFKDKHLQDNKLLFEKQECNDEIYNSPITLNELKHVIHRKTESAPGEDSISYAIFKHLPENSLITILDFFNEIWTSGKIPKMFKHAIVVPISKPDKDPKKTESYRPIALTDHLGKIMESEITNRLNYILERKKHNKS